MAVPAPAIITCPQWGAAPPRLRPQLVGRPERIIFHHTAGHGAGTIARQLDERADAIEYARALQRYHMDHNGWNDSGHNFLVMRSGLIVQGRWGTVTAIEHGRMVVSAHCPGQNDQPGIEHEHTGGEVMTAEQVEASVHLLAWICDRCGIRPTSIFPHSAYFATACPANLVTFIPHYRLDVARDLTHYGRSRPARLGPITRLRFVGVGVGVL